MLELLVGSKIEPGEGRQLLLSWLESFCIGLPRAFTFQCATILWLQFAEPGLLPWAYATTALTIPAIGFLALAMQSRVSLKAMLLGGYALTTVLAAIVLFVTHTADGAVASFTVRTWYEAELAVTGLLFWRGANRLFSAQQAKRLFPFVGTGEVVAFIMAGLVAPPISRAFGAPSLLFVSTAGTGLALLLQWIQQRGQTEDRDMLPGELPEAPGVSPWAVLRQRYPRLVASMYAVPAFCVYFLVDGVWMAELDEFFPDPDNVGEFVGHFTLVLGFVILGAKRLVAPRVLDMLGVRGGLLIPAVTMFSILLVLSWLTVDGATGTAIVVCAISLKFFERVNVQALHYPAYYILYQPMTSTEATRVQTAGETVIAPALGLIVSMALVPLNRLELVLVALAASAGYVGVAHRVGLGFKDALVAALQRGVGAGGTLDVQDASTRRGLETTLESQDAREVVYALRLLGESGYRGRGEMLAKALGHSDSIVRSEAYRLVEKYPEGVAYATVQTALDQEATADARLHAIGAAAATGASDATPAIMPMLDDEDDEVRIVAMAALMRYCGLEAIVHAGTRLMTMTSSEDEAQRVLGAKVLERTRTRELTVGMEALLDDESLSVRSAALSAAGVLDNPRLWPAVIRNLSRPGSRADAIRALTRGGEGVLSALEQAYQDDENPSLRRVILHIASRGEVGEAVPFLLGCVDGADLILRLDLLRGLSGCGYRCATDDPRMRAMLGEEVERLHATVAAFDTLGRGGETRLLRLSLREEYEQMRERILLLLSFMYPSQVIKQVGDQLALDGEGRADLAGELLGETLRGKDREFIPQLVLDLEKRALHSERVSLDDLTRSVDALSKQRKHWPGRWTHACILDAAARLTEAQAEGMVSLAAEVPTLEAPRPSEATWVPRVMSSIPPGDLPLMRRARIVKRAALFAELAGERLCDVAEAMHERRYEQGEAVIEKGGDGSELYLLVSGAVAVERPGHDPVALEAGSVFGEWSALVPAPRAATVRATEPAHVLYIGRDDLRALMEVHVDLTRGIIGVLCAKLRELRIKQLGRTTTSRRPGDLSAQGQFELEIPQMQKVLALRTILLFEGLDDDMLEALAARATSRFLRPGDYLFRQDEPATSMYWMKDGTVGVEVGGRPINNSGPGSVFGELSGLCSKARTVSLVANEECLLMRVSQHAVYDLIEANPAFGDAIIGTLVKRLRS